MQEHLEQFSVMRMAKILAVSQSGFYYLLKNHHKSSERDRARTQRDAAVKKAFEANKGRDGAGRIQVELAEQGNKHNLKTITDSMKRQSLAAKAARKFKVTTDSNHSLPAAPNLLERNLLLTHRIRSGQVISPT